MKTILDQIVERKKEELAASKRNTSQSDLQKKCFDSEPARDFLKNFVSGEFNIIAEIKKASPSKGIIRADFNPIDLACIYADSGAKALSVLTDEHFFQGSLTYLEQIKKKVTLPCLRKDFTINEYHLFEARANGADAILLIAAILDPFQLRDYVKIAEELGMKALVEVHNAEELKKVLLASNPRMVGVNNRNLATFEVGLETSLQLAPQIPQGILKVTESGIFERAHLETLSKAGFEGFLIGESLMREKDVGKKLRELIG